MVLKAGVTRDRAVIEKELIALVREKIVEFSARQFVVVADTTKLVTELGERVTLPVEIVPFGYRGTLVHLAGVQDGAQARLRVQDGEPVRSDNDNFIAELRFRSGFDPREMDARIRHLPGVVDTGFFLGFATLAYVAGPNGVERFRR